MTAYLHLRALVKEKVQPSRRATTQAAGANLTPPIINIHL